MDAYRATLQLHSLSRTSPFVVRADMPLYQVVAEYDLGASPCFLIEDTEGHVIGAVSTEEILMRMAAWNDVERLRWSEMTIESLMKTRLDIPNAKVSSSKPPDLGAMEITAITHESKLVGMLSNQDLFVSWSHIEHILNGAFVDTVTGLPNRNVFERRLAEEFRRAGRLGHSLAVILIDCDHFKEINDTHGHAVGDRVLHYLGMCLRNHLRSYDTAVRYGGDEFAVLCSGCRAGEIDIPIKRFLSEFYSQFPVAEIGTPMVSLSVGAAVVHDVSQLDRVNDLVDLADDCLYRSKRGGRGRANRVELGFGSDTNEQPQEIFVRDGQEVQGAAS